VPSSGIKTYYKNDGVAVYNANALQKEHLIIFQEKIAANLYNHTRITCLCGNSSEQAPPISEKDRYGINVGFYLCENCGIIYQAAPLSEKSLEGFYRDDYNYIYKGRNKDLDTLFKKALVRGERFFSLIQEYGITEIKSVFESGCATGANLYQFYKHGVSVEGFDYDSKLINYGKELGMNLKIGEPDCSSPQYDLVISSHVLEHVLSPIDYLGSLLSKTRVNGFILLEIPGIFSFHNNNLRLIDNLVNAHIWYFHEQVLLRLFEYMGLEIIHSDEHCTFILKKTSGQFSVTEIEGKFCQHQRSDDASKVASYLRTLSRSEVMGLIMVRRGISRIKNLLRRFKF